MDSCTRDRFAGVRAQHASPTKLYLNYGHVDRQWVSIAGLIARNDEKWIACLLLSRVSDIEIICLKEKLDTSSSACTVGHYVDYLVNSLLLAFLRSPSSFSFFSPVEESIGEIFHVVPIEFRATYWIQAGLPMDE